MNFKPHQMGMLLSGIALLLILAGLGYAAHALGILRVYSDLDSLRGAVESTGALAPVVFIGLQALQVVLAPIPGELTGAVAGLVFGGALGAVFATVGLAIGSAIAFGLGRAFGLPLVRLFVSPAQLDRFAFLQGKRGAIITLVIFIIPGFPKDVATYLFAISPIDFFRFFLMSQLGRLPGTVMLTYSGSALIEGNWLVIGILSVSAALMALAAFFWRKRIGEYLRERDH